MPQTQIETPFYRPTPNFAIRSPQTNAEGALRQILVLTSAGSPASLPEAKTRLSTVALLAQEGLGAETIFEMVCRILTADRSEPVTR